MSGLNDTAWQLVAFRQADSITPPIPGTTLTARFEAARVGGAGGCNTYGADATYDSGDEGAIAITQLVTTEIFCSEPPGVNEQEARFYESLQAAKKFQADDKSLLLTIDELNSLEFTALGVKKY